MTALPITDAIRSALGDVDNDNPIVNLYTAEDIQLALTDAGYAIVTADELARQRTLAAKVDGCSDQGNGSVSCDYGTFSMATRLLAWLREPPEAEHATPDNTPNTDTIERAAAVIEDKLEDHEVDCMTYCYGGSYPVRAATADVAQALAAAGLLAAPTSTADPIVSRYVMLDVWLALGGNVNDFEEWMSDPKRTDADAWAQLLAAIRGDLMEGDHNPEPGLILALVRTDAPTSTAEQDVIDAAVALAAAGYYPPPTWDGEMVAKLLAPLCAAVDRLAATRNQP